MLPCKLSPACKDYLWGGRRLIEEYGKAFAGERLAETWELSTHPDGLSRIAGGPEDGRCLRDALREHPEAFGSRVLGSRALGLRGTDCGAEGGDLPVLIKLIDARQDLSIQVHPGDDYARRVERAAGKTEMWVVVDCEPDARLLYGFTRTLDREEFRRRIRDGTLTDVVRSVPVKPGDVFFIDAGTLHAIGRGILIAEIQQSSNLTYRVYDYGRLGDDGKPRALHIDKAVDVTTLAPPARAPGPAGPEEIVPGGRRTLLADCAYFKVWRCEAEGAFRLEAGADSFHSLLCLGGALRASCGTTALDARKGDSLFIPAGTGPYTVEGAGTFLLTTV